MSLGLLRGWFAPHGKRIILISVVLASTCWLVPVRVSKRIKTSNIVLLLGSGTRVAVSSDASSVLVVAIASVLLLVVCIQWVRVGVHRETIVMILTPTVIIGSALVLATRLTVVVKVGIVGGLLLLLRSILVALIVALILVVLLRRRLLIVLLLAIIVDCSLLIKRGKTVSLVQDCKSVHFCVLRPSDVTQLRCCLVALSVN